ncbi:unnamed protein product [Lepeophtheirus salmonis]|uniref:(salmon louse) hypothetical protein n=1 Tax=Lepeophtheirus salmonis TaxID=72036 RepID=A0A7R8H2T1_LEPSM|nr:unnamed protein product [Lepeophtheirus salmonis]CAF2831716.1 unnamed protein product [Lepeophtheirus salmonis]
MLYQKVHQRIKQSSKIWITVNLLIRKPSQKNTGIHDSNKDKVKEYRSRNDVKEDNDNLVIGKSKIAQLGPPHVCLSSDTQKIICVFVSSTTKAFTRRTILLECVQRHVPRIVLKSSTEFVSSVVYSTDDPQCTLNTCEECQNAQIFQSSIEDHISVEEKKPETTWYAWDSTAQFLKHCFTKQKQSSLFEGKKKTVQSGRDSVVLQVDFAEEFTSAYQDEIQSDHWNQKKLSILTSIAWSDADP